MNSRMITRPVPDPVLPEAVGPVLAEAAPAATAAFRSAREQFDREEEVINRHRVNLLSEEIEVIDNGSALTLVAGPVDGTGNAVAGAPVPFRTTGRTALDGAAVSLLRPQRADTAAWWRIAGRAERVRILSSSCLEAALVAEGSTGAFADVGGDRHRIVDLAAARSARSAEQVHLTYGADPAREVVVSWVTPTSVSNPKVLVGTAAGGFGRTIEAETRTYTDANNGIETIAQHARIEGLHPATDYVYQVVSDGATQVSGAFRTAPKGRAPFRFTSVGDIACGDTAFARESLNAAATAAAIEQFDPVVHLVNGDLSYANSNQLTQPQVWAEYFNNTQLSAANRPWMPTLGNHENEPGNGPQGYLSYQTRFTLPKNQTADFEGNWYSFQIGSVLFIALDNNDVCFQNDCGTFLSTGNAQYLLGYSGGKQEKWLEETLSHASVDSTVDWIVVYMHQPAMSTSDAGGSDLGIRESWMPLFYKYGADFVLAGHDHDYERSYVVHGTDSGTYLRPSVISTDLDKVDSDKGLVHLVIGTGGTKGHDDVYVAGAGGDPVEAVHTVVGEAAGSDPQESEVAPRSATPYPAPVEFDTFTASRTRSDGFGFRQRDAK